MRETTRMLENLHQYDVLRTDRTTAAWGLEVRVPFLDKEFTNYIMSVDCKYKRCSKGKNRKTLNSNLLIITYLTLFYGDLKTHLVTLLDTHG